MAGTPDVANYMVFLRSSAGISPAYLPDGAPIIQHSLDQGLNFTNESLGIVGSRPGSWSVYELAVYNLAAHLLIEYASDASYAISAISWSAGRVTATTSAPHLIQPGDRLVLAGVSPLGYSGSVQSGVRQAYIIADAVPDSTHFSYPLAANPGAATLLPGAAATEQFFTMARRGYKINSFAPGIVSSANDLSTGVGLVVPDFMRNLTLQNLQLVKTPFGRAYLEIAQQYGPTAWGLA